VSSGGTTEEQRESTTTGPKGKFLREREGAIVSPQWGESDAGSIIKERKKTIKKKTGDQKGRGEGDPFSINDINKHNIKGE